MDATTVDTTVPPFETEFFVSGGTMPETAASYVERAADRQLLDALLQSKFCYVLNSRQMGKSSLCVRVKSELLRRGVACAFVDLTRIGGQNLTPEQWYAGVLGEIGRSLGLRTEVLAYWKEHSQESPMQRVFGALREVVLNKTTGLVAIFVDEIDAARSLPFNADEFLTGIRECYNRRAHDPVYNRLTFCLLGAAVPSDLIRDARTTPFNIGERIYLRDFTLQEASALAKGLGAGREHLLNRVYYWTNGHPFLTQSLCNVIEHEPTIREDKDVDALVSRDLFNPKARETNINLADVSNRVLNGYADGEDVDKFRADILSAYAKALSGKAALVDDESNRVTAVLKLSGLMRSEGKELRVRNPIYERVFGRDWVRENMPGQELRRQRRAFLVGVLRTGAIAAVVVCVISVLAVRNYQLFHVAQAERDRANYEVYVSDMNLMPALWQRGDIGRMSNLLDATARNASRGWEWSLWNRLVHLSSAETRITSGFDVSPDGSRLLVRLEDSVELVDAKTFAVIKTFPVSRSGIRVEFLPDGKRATVDGGKGTSIYDLTTGTQVALIPGVHIAGRRTISPDGAWAIARNDVDLPVKVDLVHFMSSLVADKTTGIVWKQLSRAGDRVIFGEEYSNSHPADLAVSVRETKTWKEIARLHPLSSPGAVALNANGTRAVTGTSDGWLQYWNVDTGKELWRTKAQTEGIQAVDISDDGKWLLSTGRERFGHVYALSDEGPRLLRTYPDANGGQFDPSEKRVYFSYWTLRAYDLTAEDALPVIHVPVKNVRGGGVAADGLAIAAANAFSVFKINLEADRQLVPLPKNELPVANGDASRHWIFRQPPGEGFDIWDVADDKLIGHIAIDNKTFFPLSAFPNQNKVLLTGNHKVVVWNCDENKVDRTLDLGDEQGTFAAASADGNTVAVGRTDGLLYLFDMSTGASRTVPVGFHQIWNISFSDDGQELVASCDEDVASVVDLRSARLKFKLVGHSQTVNFATFSPEGSRIATGSDDGTARIWDANTGRELTDLDIGSEVRAVQFISNGSALVTLSRDATIRIWPTGSVSQTSL